MATAAPVKFTTNSLIAHLRGELDMDPNAAGGTIPDRVRTTVALAGMSLWDSWDWVFRRKQGSLVTASGTNTVDFPTDFAELDQRWLRDAANVAGIRFTSDPTEFQRVADMYQSADTGAPVIACIRRKTPGAGVTDYALQALLAPIPDAIYTYPYWYMILNPWSAAALADDDAYPIWPHTFSEGWRLLAKRNLQEAYGKEEESERTGKMFDRWLQQQLSENDEMLSRPTERIRDGYGDFGGGLSLVSDRSGRDFYNW